MQIQQPSVLGQIPLNFYTQVLLGFPLESQEIEAAVQSLNHGVQVLIRTFPFLAGQVILEGKDSTSSGIYRVVPQQHLDILRVKDCTALCPSYNEIVHAKAPGSMLNGDILTPMKGLPESHDPKNGLPVFILQLNIVNGGAILCSSCVHQSLDMNGQGHLLILLAQACNNQPISEEDVNAGNLDGASVIPLLRSDENPLEHENFRGPSRLGPEQPTGISTAAPWTYFRFAKSSLAKFKAEASLHLDKSTIEWISTNDALAAFIWQRLGSARSRRFSQETSMFCDRLVNIRGRLKPPVPAGYMGHMLILDQIALSFRQLACSSLSDIASQLRQSLNSIDDHHIRSAATLLQNEKDKSTFQYGANAVGDRDLTISSWAGLQLASVSFGFPLGQPTFVRRAIQADCEGLAYLMPTTIDGDIDVAVSLRKDDLDVLEQDSVWRNFAETIG
jgi:trichothecene 3-O-acetyltransferase